MKKSVFILLMIFLFASKIYATHNRAGQIVYRHVSGYTYDVEIWTYTYSLSQADRDSLTIKWGDGTETVLPRVQKTLLPDYYYENKYVGRHTYPGPGTFELVMEDPNRNEGVLNIPNSVNTVFALKTTLQINPFLGNNSAAVLLTRPIDKAAKGQIFIHNPGAYDPDGDSLSFKMDTCRYNNGEKIPGFTLPPATDSIYVDPITGDLVWNTPPQIGIYNVAMRIEEWRKGVKISSIIRDIQIEVEETDNNPPVVQDLADMCVVAGDYIQFDVTATDPDNDIVMLEASGGPFHLDTSVAQFPDSVSGVGTVTGTFSWQTVCQHISPAPYIVTFKATDDNPDVKLVDYETIKIRVIGPPVEFSSIEASNTNVILKWQGNGCPNLTGYKIYRKNENENFGIDSCQTGIPDSWGYELIETITDTTLHLYVDEHLTPGFVYCYRIVPVYDGKIDGIPSHKACIEIAEGLPILTKASVLQTAVDTGKIRVEWVKPLNLDTNLYKGPYRFLLSMSRDLFGTNYIKTEVFDGLDADSYIDSNVNTKDNPSCYKLEFQNYDSLTNSYVTIGEASVASTPFLKIYSADRRNDLYIDENVPWQNDYYVIYRKNETTGVFDSIGYTNTATYSDRNLINEKEYCYKVKSVSHYSADSLPNPIINFSQERCGTPIDTIPPCCPDFTLSSDCDNYRNIIHWSMPADSCYDGLAKIYVYYTSRLDGDFVKVGEFLATDTVYYHYPDESLAGCYILTGVDSTGNESVCTDKQCIDVCSYYELPNVFTPNADNVNDLYHPYPYKFVDHVDMKIYNRWGTLIFQTDDPDINWDGKDMNTGKPVPDGVYYYICDVYEERLTGIIPRNISGFIHVYSESDKKSP